MLIRISLTLLFCITLAGCGDTAETSGDAEPSGETTTEAPASAAEETDDAATDTEEKTAQTEGESMSGPLSFEMESLAGEKVALSKYGGKVVLVVNVASKCGLTPQYEQLQALHTKYAEKGLSVVGFPCNQFGGQEPGSAQDIQQFCSENYGVAFDMMAKVDVNGDDACELYKYLTGLETEPQGAGDISWNFEKFLIDRSGKVINRFSPRTKPDAAEVTAAIETAIAAAP